MTEFADTGGIPMDSRSTSARPSLPRGFVVYFFVAEIANTGGISGFGSQLIRPWLTRHSRAIASIHGFTTHFLVAARVFIPSLVASCGCCCLCCCFGLAPQAFGPEVASAVRPGYCLSQSSTPLVHPCQALKPGSSILEPLLNLGYTDAPAHPALSRMRGGASQCTGT